MEKGTANFMSIPLLTALRRHYGDVEDAAIDPTIDVPGELNFIPGPGADLESMIWVLTYALMLRHQEGLQGFKKVWYKLKTVDQRYGSLSYSGIEQKRISMMFSGYHFSHEPEQWIPDPVPCKWFRKAMALVSGRLLPILHGSTKDITFDAFDALCDEFITDE